MKKNFTLFVFLTMICAFTHAQYTEMKPNNSFQTANYLPFGSSMTGQTCSDTGYGFYVMVVPMSGALRISTSSATVDSVPSKPYDLAIIVYSKDELVRGVYSIKVGDSISVNDTLSWSCIPSDSIYVVINCPNFTTYCFNYTFSCSVVAPAFAANTNPNHSFASAVSLAQGATANGQLGFKSEPNDTLLSDYYQGVLTGDGALQIFTDVDYSSASSPGLNVSVYNKDLQLVDSLEARIGTLDLPLMDTLSANCMPADTFYLRLSQNNTSDCGWSYNLSYNILPPVFGDDMEPNNSFAEAQNMMVGDSTFGNAYYGTDHSDDYFKFYKPDNGFIQVLIYAESQLGGGNMTVYLYDKNDNPIDTATVLVGTPDNLGQGLIYLQTLPEDSFYLQVVWPGNGHCGSYSIQITTSTVASVKNLELLPVSVMPNPSSGDFTFNLTGYHVTALQLYDMDGRVVESIADARLQNRLVTVGGELESGVYIARLFEGNKVTGITKLVKTR